MSKEKRITLDEVLGTTNAKRPKRAEPVVLGFQGSALDLAIAKNKPVAIEHATLAGSARVDEATSNAAWWELSRSVFNGADGAKGRDVATVTARFEARKDEGDEWKKAWVEWVKDTFNNPFGEGYKARAKTRGSKFTEEQLKEACKKAFQRARSQVKQDLGLVEAKPQDEKSIYSMFENPLISWCRMVDRKREEGVNVPQKMRELYATISSQVAYEKKDK